MSKVSFGLLSVDFVCAAGDRLPGTSAEKIAMSVLGQIPPTLTPRPTRRRYPVIAARLPLDLIPSDTDKSVVVRPGGATVAGFDAQTASASAVVSVTVGGKPPPIGSTRRGSSSCS